jgi:anti-sigma-K factor RskA
MSAWRVLLLALYYVAIVVGVLAVHTTPDRASAPFVYQAF